MEKNHNSVSDDQPDGVAEPRRAPRPKATSPPRKDAKRLHITRHGILSRAPMEALVHRGVNLRELRKIERLLRVQLRPQGIFAELIFDRAWASYLRCLLIADVEKQAFTMDHPADGATRLPALAERERPTLIFGDDANALNGFSPELMSHLAIVQRYDGHFAREFYRAAGMLLALKTVGETGLAAMFGQKI
jgi:hypothetical protein